MTLLDVAMRERHLTNRALSLELGVSPATVATWRRGSFRPLGAHAEKLAAIFRIPAARLCAEVHIRTNEE